MNAATRTPLTIDEWRERARQNFRKGLFVGMFWDGDTRDGLRVRVKRVWPNRLEVIFLDPRPADEFGPAAPADRVESVHPASVIPIGGLW